MKVLYKIGGICFFICIGVLQGCSQPELEHSYNDPYHDLPVIETEVFLEINDQDSANAGKFYFLSKYFQDMTISKEGHFFVVDGRSASIQHFDKDGEFIANIGSKGRGPGEFQTSPFFDVQNQDTLFALDPVLWMINVFINSNGEWFHANSFNLEQRNDVRPAGIHQLNRNQLAIEYAPNLRRLITENNKSELRKTIDLVSDEGEKILDTLLSAPINQQSVYTSRSRSSIIHDVPFGSKSILDIGPENSFYHLVTDDFLIKIYDNEGQLRDSIKHPSFTIELSEDQRWSSIEEAVSASTGSDSEDQAMKEKMFGEIPTSAYPLNDMYVDRDTGHIIVERSEVYDGPNWLLLNPEGKRIGVFDLDESLNVFEYRNGKIIGALMNEDEVALPAILIVSLLQVDI